MPYNGYHISNFEERFALKVLLLEDSMTDSELVRRVLTNDFHLDFTHVEDQPSFEKQLLSNSFDIIIVDFILPTFSGIEALELRNRLGIDTPVVVLSSSIKPKDQILCLQNNASDVIGKSDLKRIPYVIKRCINEFQQNRILKDVLEQQREYIREKDILVAEIHHRVKNNLAVVSGLLELSKLQIDQDSVIHKSLDNNIMRIKAMALVHECLYKDQEMTHVDIEAYISNLIYHMKLFYSSEVLDLEIIERIQSTKVNINQAIPLGLIIAELVTNAIKHAFTDRTKKAHKIFIDFIRHNNSAKMIIQDNGSGMHEEDSGDLTSGFGTKLVSSLVMQLEATLHSDSNENGTKFEIIFQLSEKRGSSNALS